MNYEIDTVKILNRLFRFAWLMILCFAVGAVGGFVYASKFKTETYTATTSIIVRSQVGEEISQTQIDASERLVETCIPILTSDTVINNDVLGTTGLQYTNAQIRSMTSMSAINETQVLRITVTAPSAQDAYQIASAYATYGSQTVMEKLDGGFVTVLDEATLPEEPNGSGALRTGLVLGLLFALICAGVISVITMLDTRIKDEEELDRIRGDIPVIGIIPSFDTNSSDNYGYRTGHSGREG